MRTLTIILAALVAVAAVPAGTVAQPTPDGASIEYQTISGTVTAPGGEAMSNTTLIFYIDEYFEPRRIHVLAHTNSSGGFSVQVRDSYSYDVVAYQANVTIGDGGGFVPANDAAPYFPDDGVADIYPVANDIYGSYGPYQWAVPTGFQTDVIVSDQDGKPVSGATVSVYTEGTDYFPAWYEHNFTTNSNGRLAPAYSNSTGLELNHYAEITVYPPDSPAFANASAHTVRKDILGPIGDITFTLDRDSTAPKAAFSWTPQTPAVGTSVTFSAADSSGSVSRYAWDFNDDGLTDATGETATHTFESVGNKTVTLTVTDSSGSTDTVSKTVTVQATDDTEPQGRGLSIAPASSSTSIPAGGNATVTFEISNNASERRQAVVTLNQSALPQNWTLSDVSGTDPNPQDQFAVVAGDSQVTFSDVDPGETVTASATVSVPANSSTDTAVLSASAQNGSGSAVGTARVTITVGSSSVVGQYDQDGDGIETTELLAGISDWRGGRLDVTELLTLIESWRGGGV